MGNVGSVAYPKLQGADSRLSARPGSAQQQRESEAGSRRTSRHSDAAAYPSVMDGQRSRRTTAEQQTGQAVPPQHAPHPSEGQRLPRSTAEQQAAQPQYAPYPSVSLPADQHRRSSRPLSTGGRPSAGPGELRESRRTTADGRPSENGDAGSGRESNFGQGVKHQQWPGADASVAVSHSGGLPPHFTHWSVHIDSQERQQGLAGERHTCQDACALRESLCGGLNTERRSGMRLLQVHSASGASPQRSLIGSSGPGVGS